MKLLRQILLCCVLLGSCAATRAEMIVVYKTATAIVTLDRTSLQRSGTHLRYRSIQEDLYPLRRESSANVIVDCVERKRALHGATLSWYAVYPNTRDGDEVSGACEQAEVDGHLPAELARAQAAFWPAQPIRQASPKTRPDERSGSPSPEPQDRSSSSGSGFFVTPNALITNNHVVEDCKTFEVRHGKATYVASVTAKSERSDLALLSVQQPIGSPPEIRQTALLGEDIMVAGHPLAGLLTKDLIVTSGQINSLAGLNDESTLLQISAPVQRGNSGGPVLDRQGKVVGVVVSKLDVMRIAAITGDLSQNINFAIKPEVLRMFLEVNKIPFRSGGKGNRMENTDLAELAKTFTVQVHCTK